ncbi:MAG TPA: sigma-70 family RNA polymerase sigma factor [Ktedonobacterales bacterium]|nr:sigma-70 family RNA polymerase sigma factor [Ktedonobacterales bacterium]
MSDIAAADELGQIRRAATGDHAAFALLVRRYEARIVIYLRQTVGDADLASDLAQETFLAAYQALPRWQPPPDLANPPSRTTDLLSPWLYRIATNHAISTLRRQTMSARRTPVSAARASFSLEDAVIGRELLRAALATLDEDDAACLVLHYVAGERYGEIAARLGISSEAVRKRVGRALSSLRQAYAAMETGEQR